MAIGVGRFTLIAVSRLPFPATEPKSWLSRHRGECLLLVVALTVFVSIWWNLQHSGPQQQDVVRAVDRYIAQLRAVESRKTGSLRKEMQVAVLSPHLRDLQISDRRRFPGYWSIDAVMRLERPLVLPIDVSVRLRVTRRNDRWVILDAQDLSSHVVENKTGLISK